MKHSVAHRALIAAAFSACAFGANNLAYASTEDDVRELKALLLQQQKRIQQLESRGGGSHSHHANPIMNNPRGTGQGLLGTGTSGSNPSEVGTARGTPSAPSADGRYAGGSAPDPSASLQQWYNRISIRGYTQMRYTNFLQNSQFANNDVYWADGSARPRSNFLIRRMRLIFSGDVSDHLYIYIQPDFASTPPGGASNGSVYAAALNTPAAISGSTPAVGANGILPGYYGVWQGPYQPVNAYYQGMVGSNTSAVGGNFAQLRDAYADIYFDHDKEFRVRAGQSKVPYGFTNMQSSQNRLTLDRPDALNTATRDERDLGLFFYYTPKDMRHLFRDLVKNNLKGSGDYGMFGFGVYNGQGANRAELNKNTHLVARFTYPYVFESGQVVEASIQGYTGRVMPITGAIRPSLGMGTNWAGNVMLPAFQPGSNSYLPVVVAPGYNVPGNYNLGYWPRTTGWSPACANGCEGVQDSRVALTGVIYPQPFGIQSEWNWGVSPGLNATQTAITPQKINGGYVLVNYKYEDKDYGLGTFFPYVQYQYFNGFSKYEVNAPQNRVNEWDIGIEYQPLPEVEITASYNKSDRTNITAAPYRQFQADTLRWQLQWNY